MVCLGIPAIEISIPGDLITIESHSVDLNSRDKDLKKTLIEISNTGRVPVDVFCSPSDEVKRLKSLAGKILVMSPDAHTNF